MRAKQAEGPKELWGRHGIGARIKRKGKHRTEVRQVTEDREATEVEGGCGGRGSHVMALSATP
jgi:hypothetical protein